jgi:hypothetical protein
VVGEYLFASTTDYLQVFMAETLAWVKDIYLGFLLGKMLPFNHKGSDYVVALN